MNGQQESVSGVEFAVESALLMPFLSIRLYASDTASFQAGDASFSKFPDSIDKSIHNTDNFLDRNWDCPTADVFPLPNGLQLAICGALKSEPTHPQTYAIELKSDFFFVIVKKRDGTTRLLFYDGGWGGNPFVLKQSRNNFDFLESLEDSSRFYPVFKTSIACGRDSCSVGKEVCSIDIPKDIHPDVVQRIQADAHKPLADIPHYMNFVTHYSHQLLLRALGGDAKAADILIHFPFPVDAAPAELVGSDQDTYTKAKTMGCLSR